MLGRQATKHLVQLPQFRFVQAADKLSYHIIYIAAILATWYARPRNRPGSRPQPYFNKAEGNLRQFSKVLYIIRHILANTAGEAEYHTSYTFKVHLDMIKSI